MSPMKAMVTLRVTNRHNVQQISSTFVILLMDLTKIVNIN